MSAAMSTSGAAPVVAWRAQWVGSTGRTAWTEFSTREQAELFALRRRGCVVDVLPVEGPVPRPSLIVVPREADEQAADRLEALAAGLPATGPEEHRLLDVVAGLRRISLPAVPARVSRELRDRLLRPAS
jgi:hypothetical protein